MSYRNQSTCMLFPISASAWIWIWPDLDMGYGYGYRVRVRVRVDVDRMDARARASIRMSRDTSMLIAHWRPFPIEDELWRWHCQSFSQEKRIPSKMAGTHCPRRFHSKCVLLWLRVQWLDGFGCRSSQWWYNGLSMLPVTIVQFFFALYPVVVKRFANQGGAAANGYIFTFYRWVTHPTIYPVHAARQDIQRPLDL